MTIQNALLELVWILLPVVWLSRFDWRKESR